MYTRFSSANTAKSSVNGGETFEELREKVKGERWSGKV
jgi:hypothetical protein